MPSKRKGFAAAAAITIACGWLVALAQTPEPGGVVVLTVQDAIGPATSSYVVKGIDEAAQVGAELVVLELDTPGGLDTSMREIIQAILLSPVPVATYVYPEGARAASAGTYILYASHIAAMAPATNLGAATPVAIGGGSSPLPMPGDTDPADPADRADSADDADEPGDAGQARDAPADRPPAVPEPATTSERKAINDAVAYIRSLAERRGRNADWAESAVRSSTSLSATAALEQNVIDVIAANLDDLLRQLDGRELEGGVLSLPDSTIISRIEPDWRTRVLAVISNPTVAYMLLLLGIYGLVFEGYNPGAIVPGVVGAISLLLALFALQVLPVNYAGLALILLGVVLILAEFFVPSFGALGIGGVAAFVFGSLILIDTDAPGFDIATPLITSIAASGAAALFGTAWLAMRSRERHVVSGIEEMPGLEAEALEDFSETGYVWVHGERWRARTRTPVKRGQRLKVLTANGLELEVEPAAST
jgi:membrane-bound serine protease (ClpP class)